MKNQRGESEFKAILALIGFLLGLIITFFIADFLDEYKKELYQDLHLFIRILSITLIIGIVAVFIVIIIWFFSKMATENNERQLNQREIESNISKTRSENELADAMNTAIRKGDVYLKNHKTQSAHLEFAAMPKSSKNSGMNSAKALKKIALTEPIAQEQTALKTTLLNDIKDSQRILISGGSGTGKTSLLLWIAEQRDKIGQLSVLDIDGKPNKWGAYKAHGAGEDFKEFADELKRIDKIFDERKLQLKQGVFDERSFPLITVIIDEWQDTVELWEDEEADILPLKDLVKIIKKLLRRGRKLSIDIIIISNGLTADSLAFHGSMDMLHNFEARIRLDKVENKRVAYVAFGKSKEEVIYEHCGAFNYAKKISHPPINLTKPIPDKDQKILEVFDKLVAANAYSKSKLSSEVFGNKNSRYFAEIDDVLSRHGRVTSE